MTNLEKRLVALSHLGINITHESGHRWIESNENSDFDFHEYLNKTGIILNNKIYGGVEDALNVIDACFKQNSDDTLLEFFEKYIEEEACKQYYETAQEQNRIDLVEKGQGGLY